MKSSLFRINSMLDESTPKSVSSDSGSAMKLKRQPDGSEFVKKVKKKGQFELDLVKKCTCKKVLVVDDLAFNLLAVELMLKKKFNLSIDKAFSGEEAIIKVKQKLMSP